MADTDLSGLVKKLGATDDCDPYWDNQGKTYRAPEASGYTAVEILDYLKGLPLTNLVMAYVRGFRPSKVRITSDMTTLDCCRWRVTILVREEKGVFVVERITQEVEIGYGSGYNVGLVLKAALLGQEPPKTSGGGVVGHTAGLERIDFS